MLGVTCLIVCLFVSSILVVVCVMGVSQANVYFCVTLFFFFGKVDRPHDLQERHEQLVRELPHHDS